MHSFSMIHAVTISANVNLGRQTAIIVYSVLPDKSVTRAARRALKHEEGIQATLTLKLAETDLIGRNGNWVRAVSGRGRWQDAATGEMDGGEVSNPWLPVYTDDDENWPSESVRNRRSRRDANVTLVLTRSCLTKLRKLPNAVTYILFPVGCVSITALEASNYLVQSS